VTTSTPTRLPIARCQGFDVAVHTVPMTTRLDVVDVSPDDEPNYRWLCPKCFRRVQASLAG
jgi:hypothetical protein